MRLSVALATHNGDRFIAEQLGSVLTQSRPPHEIVVADDASSDRTLEVVARVMKKTPASTHVVVLPSNERLGVVANFDRAVRWTTGDVVFLCDQDDIWEPTKLETVARVFEGASTGVLGVFTDGHLVDASGTVLPGRLWQRVGFRRPHNEGLDLKEVLRWNPVTGAALAFSSAARDLALPFPATTIHDRWIAMLAAAAGTMIPIDEPLIRYRLHGGNVLGLESSNPLTALRSRRTLERRFERELETIDGAVGRLEAAGRLRPASAAAFAEARAFLAYRAELPLTARSRVLPVMRHLLRGSYRRHARGPRSAAYDLLVGDRS